MSKMKQVGEMENKSFEEGDILYIEGKNGKFAIGKFRGFAELNPLQKALGYQEFRLIVECHNIIHDGLVKLRVDAIEKIKVLK